MNYPHLFEPIRLGPVLIKNRVFLGASAPNYSESPNGHYTNKYLDFYRERVKNDVGLVLTGHIKAERAIDPYPCGYKFPCLDEPSEIKYFREMTDMVHRYGAKIAIELSPGTGRLADCLLPDHPPVGPSEIPLYRWPEKRARALTVEEIRQLEESYGRAAENAVKAGFDFVYIHCLAYLIDQFLTPCWNTRTDEYGGGIENRMRFMVECIESVQRHIGKRFPLIGGLAMDAGIPGGKTMEDVVTIAKKMEELGLVAIHLRNGSYDRKNALDPTALDPECFSVENAARVKAHLHIPVLVDGALMRPENCERVLEEGKADMTGLVRPLIADPEWIVKAKNGREDDIRTCLRCGECQVSNASGLYSVCSVNPCVGHEAEKLQKAETPRRILVIGGGQAGMATAMYAAQRGHWVTIVEKSGDLGGHILQSAKPYFKETNRRYLAWLRKQVEELPVSVELETEADEAYIETFAPDAIVVCTGSTPIAPPVPGIGKQNVRFAVDVLLDETGVGRRVAVVGSGLVGCELALHLAHGGKAVTLIDMLPEIGREVNYLEKPVMMEKLAEYNVRLRPGRTLAEVADDGIVVTDAGGNPERIEADTVILAAGLRSEDRLYERLLPRYPRVYAVGDCIRPGKFYTTNAQAYAVAAIL